MRDAASLDDAIDADWRAAWAAELDRPMRTAAERRTPPQEWPEVRAQILDRITRR